MKTAVAKKNRSLHTMANGVKIIIAKNAEVLLNTLHFVTASDLVGI